MLIMTTIIALVLAHCRELHLKEHETKLKEISANLEHARNMDKDSMTWQKNVEVTKECNRVFERKLEHQNRCIQSGIEAQRLEAIEAPRRQSGNGCVVS